ncbi:SIR2 family protein [Romboutsia sp.]|uniref:SIR2 family protein n=1 Tax=Romboutsia sp. TaxID=1965302 RepID=UPI002BD8E0E6|nr:SIR2 family protein [Romboutsia sp.]HSQ90236.1 SIR2 family protein [Romboutsia sp.]
MNICIFLGAGASAAENSPIQNELFSEYFKSLTPKDFDNYMNKELYKFFKQMFNIDVINDDMEKVNFPTFEEVLGLLDLAEQRRESFKNFGLETLNKKSASIRFLRQYLILLMAKAIHKSEGRRNEYHKMLVDNLLKENLLENTTFISANYDIHIDNTIASLYSEKKQHIMLDYGVDFTNFYLENEWEKPVEPCVKLYKIHGSLNWLYCPICNSLTLTPYEGGVMRLLDNIKEAKCLECKEITVPIIIPPTYFKNMSNVFISTVWRNVEKTLRKSDVLVFCGYSFADADIHIKYMLKRVQSSREKSPLKIMVFNNYDAKKEYSLKKEEDRYKRFLGEDVVYTRNSFQDFAKDPIKYLN